MVPAIGGKPSLSISGEIVCYTPRIKGCPPRHTVGTRPRRESASFPLLPPSTSLADEQPLVFYTARCRSIAAHEHEPPPKLHAVKIEMQLAVFDRSAGITEAKVGPGPSVETIEALGTHAPNCLVQHAPFGPTRLAVGVLVASIGFSSRC